MKLGTLLALVMIVFGVAGLLFAYLSIKELEAVNSAVLERVDQSQTSRTTTYDKLLPSHPRDPYPRHRPGPTPSDPKFAEQDPYLAKKPEFAVLDPSLARKNVDAKVEDDYDFVRNLLIQSGLLIVLGILALVISFHSTESSPDHLAVTKSQADVDFDLKMALRKALTLEKRQAYALAIHAFEAVVDKAGDEHLSTRLAREHIEQLKAKLVEGNVPPETGPTGAG